MPDYGAVACAAERLVSDRPLYVPGQRTNCEGYESPPYLYPPFLAGVEAGLQAMFGLEGARILYMGMYLAALAYISWRIFLSAATPGARSARYPYLGLIPATPIWWANYATLAHAVVLLVSASAWRAPWLFAGTTFVLGMIKPSYLAYLLVLACLPFPIWRRVFMTTAPIVLAAVALGAFILTGEESSQAWLDSLAFVSLEWVSGNGALAVAARLGAPDMAAAGIALTFATIIALAAVIVCEEGEASIEQRIFIGLAAAVIAMPRVMPYDVFMLAPGMVALVSLAKVHRPGIGVWVGRLAITGCVLAVLMSLAGYADQRLDLALACFASALILAAAGLLLRNPWRLIQDAERRAARLGPPQAP